MTRSRPVIPAIIFVLSSALLLGVLAMSVMKEAGADAVVVYKSPTCGCCTLWIDHLRANGFDVTEHDVDDVRPIKERLGLPHGLGSCHTAEVGGYVIEGHVPAADIRRLLKERPAVAGLAVPGMPMGSPGMEGAYSEPYDVLAFGRDGKTQVYAQHQ